MPRPARCSPNSPATNPAFGYESSANVTSRTINQLLGTRAFLDVVITNAGLKSSIESGVLTRDEVRASISSWSQGDNLVAVSASTANPEQSERLAAATLSSFVEYVIRNDIADAEIRIGTYEGIRDERREQYTAAFTELSNYVASHPAGDEDDRPVNERLDISRLEDAVRRADNAFIEAEANVENARLAAAVARTVVERQLHVVDEPQLPLYAEAGLRKAVMTVAVFGVLGALLALGVVVLAAMLDRTIRTPDEISARFGVEVLAVVPSARRKAT